jgi:RHH-type proline utilization regulon transcriptional repressor/proline dehydrogenase/delta 1-pyrroline-5-carboxylate dehydrogenase
MPTEIALENARTAPLASDLIPLRQRIAEAYRLPEPVCVPPLIVEACFSPALARSTAHLAEKLVEALRGERTHGFGIEALMKEFSLSSQEGVALMCLAESLLRIPDRGNRDRLIRDKLSRADWRAHAGASPSMFVNAAAWGLLITGKLVSTTSEEGLLAALTRVVARGGEPIVRASLGLAMRLLGQKFVTGQTIEEALRHAKPFEERGFSYSFDMLGEAAITAADAERYASAYEHAIHAIGQANAGKTVFEAAGISVKLSALHPRYSDVQMDRVWRDLYPRLLRLARLSSRYGIGFNIDAEEADRLDPSLDLIAALACEPDLKDWQGLGFVVQAYQKRAPFVIDYLIALAKHSGRRLMVRLVKGAYWDSEIKRAQVDGLCGYPVYTRKSYTDVCYLACAKRLLAHRDAIFPQFATHNAQTLAAIYYLAGDTFQLGDYEFQCLHGMGEGLYSHVVGARNLGRPCRIYAPVGNHDTLLAYLVRRLLENGANSSFVHQLVDGNVPVSELVADPVREAERHGGSPHPMIVEPSELFGTERKNSIGLDLSSRPERQAFLEALQASRARPPIEASPLVHGGVDGGRSKRTILNPADSADSPGTVSEASEADVESAKTAASAAADRWGKTAPSERADVLKKGADLFERERARLCALLVREGGKTLADASGEVRETVDFCRYYAAQLRSGFDEAQALGPAVCISPWNFPLAIFTGQIAAALAAGNPVLAKPAEQTPLVAFEAVRLLHEAGIPPDVLQLLPGGGEIGARLVADRRTKAVLFTGSTAVAKSIQRTLAARGDIPLIAETGGQNAMIVDSTALPEQVVADVLASAFNSAGQRCSALRVLCLQEEIADRVLAMLKGAMAELRLGDPSKADTDVGPVIDAEAQSALTAYIQRSHRKTLFQVPLPADCDRGTFVPPTLMAISAIAELQGEVFGPVLHTLRFRRDDLEGLLDAINATGYGLTMGVHSRIDETIACVIGRARAGNIYVNRNMIGAVVGVQPFGGEGLSGTGPKAGGPLYLKRLCRGATPLIVEPPLLRPELELYRAWIENSAGDLLSPSKKETLVRDLEGYARQSLAFQDVVLPSPVGEDNRLRFVPRGRLFGLAGDLTDAVRQAGAALATGNSLLIDAPESVRAVFASLPDPLRSWVRFTDDLSGADVDGILVSDGTNTAEVHVTVSERDGPIIPFVSESPRFEMSRLVKERTVTINTAAAGGNAQLLALAK